MQMNWAQYSGGCTQEESKKVCNRLLRDCNKPPLGYNGREYLSCTMQEMSELSLLLAKVAAGRKHGQKQLISLNLTGDQLLWNKKKTPKLKTREHKYLCHNTFCSQQTVIPLKGFCQNYCSGGEVLSFVFYSIKKQVVPKLLILFRHSKMLFQPLCVFTYRAA